MATLNQCSFIGRLGKDPDNCKSQMRVNRTSRFSLAVDQGKNRNHVAQRHLLGKARRSR